MRPAAFLLAISLATAGPVCAQDGASTGLSPEDADEAARKIVGFCRVLVARMDGVIDRDRSAPELESLASIWDALNCGIVYGLSPSESGGGSERGAPRWIVR